MPIFNFRKSSIPFAKSGPSKVGAPSKTKNTVAKSTRQILPTVQNMPQGQRSPAPPGLHSGARGLTFRMPGK